jgi:metal-dependent amidase/aminoacylase/carboxypeptidase family protein
MLTRIKKLAEQYRDEFIAVRRHLHAHPELSYQEWETSKFVQEKLHFFKIPYTVKAGTGVVGIIEGKNPQSRVVACAVIWMRCRLLRKTRCRINQKWKG